MGAKTTKIFRSDSFNKRINFKCKTEEIKDPRSPDVLRTPLNELNTTMEEKVMETECVFRDPRSPTTCITRTPIIFDSDQSKSFVFEEENDTFEELFSPHPDPKTKVDANNVQVDPRSPSSDIDRTPLVFENEDNVQLELPAINFSDEDEENEEELIQSVMDMLKDVDVENEKPQHKQIERVKNMHKKKKKRSTGKKSNNSSKPKENIPKIYQDANVFYSTPKKSSVLEKDSMQMAAKRTPLGCVGNGLRVRSKSVENIKNKNAFSTNAGGGNSPKYSKRITVFEIETENSSFII